MFFNNYAMHSVKKNAILPDVKLNQTEEYLYEAVY